MLSSIYRSGRKRGRFPFRGSLRNIGGALAHKGRCSGKPLEGKLIRPTKISFVELALLLAVDIPVPAIAFLLAPGGKCTQLTPESKRPGRFRCQPGIPGIRSDNNRSLLLT